MYCHYCNRMDCGTRGHARRLPAGRIWTLLGVAPDQITPGELGATRFLVLKHQLQRKLDLPRRINSPNRPECRIGNIGVRPDKVRVIQNIEELRPELYSHSF